jgi:ankyrin repeat protein
MGLFSDKTKKLLQFPMMMLQSLSMKASLIIITLFLLLHATAKANDIFDAIDSGKIDKVRSILNKHPEACRSKDKYGDTPLHKAAQRGTVDMAVLLIAKGADVNAIAKNHMTPLMYLSLPYFKESPSYKKFAELLIAKGARIDIKEGTGRTALHWAASVGRIGVAEVLVSHGAELNAKDAMGCTPLHLAAGQDAPGQIDQHIAPQIAQHIKVERLLIQKGADINARSNDGDTPLHCAVMGNLNEDGTQPIEPLILKGADVNAKNKKGETPLLMATEKDDLKVVEFLILHGANVNARDIKGNTALKLAMKNGLKNIADLLRKHGAKE